jgi:hypothetical protein
VIHQVVIRWQEGQPKERAEPWLLMTDLGPSSGGAFRKAAASCGTEGD